MQEKENNYDDVQHKLYVYNDDDGDESRVEIKKKPDEYTLQHWHIIFVVEVIVIFKCTHTLIHNASLEREKIIWYSWKKERNISQQRTITVYYFFSLCEFWNILYCFLSFFFYITTTINNSPMLMLMMMVLIVNYLFFFFFAFKYIHQLALFNHS